MPTKILVVDDEPDIVELLEYNLLKEGYEVATATNGQQAIEVAQQFVPELIIMDVMMPLMNGIEAGQKLRQIEAFKKTLLIYLTARSEEVTEIAAFDLGANDYIIKPIKPRALMSRINAFFRRETGKNNDKVVFQVAGITINQQKYSITKADGTVVILPKKEFELLYFLAKSPNKVFGRETLLAQVWGANVYVIERTVDVHIRKLREKVGDTYIRTLKGVGYMFVDE